MQHIGWAHNISWENSILRRREFSIGCAATMVGLMQSAEVRSQTGATTVSLDDTLEGSRVGPWRRLFLDSTVVESQAGLHRRFHNAEKHKDNPIITADRTWEGTSAIIGPYVYGTVLREGDRLRMWYQLLFEGNHTGYAESSDGIHWEKPPLGIFTYQGEKTNLVVSDFDVSVTGGHCHNPSVVVRPQANEIRRYALYGFDNQAGRPRVAFSRDGMHWRYSSDQQPLFSSSDVVNFAYDPYQSRYYATWKTRNRRGRAVGVAFSADGQSWNKPFDGPVFVADDLDPDDTQIYGMPAFAYQGLYIGLPWIYRARYFRFGQYSVDKLHEAQSDSARTMECQMAWSWDLINWTRPVDREQFLPRGEAGSWDGGMIVTARAPVVWRDQLYFYYGGTDKVHDDKRAKAGIGLATLRLDGFCSMAADASEGWLISRREPMREPQVYINAVTRTDGHISAELLNRKNQTVPGFSRQDCITFQGDSVKHALRWKTESFTSQQLKGDFKIRFWIKNADLYSYLPASLDPEQPDLARFPNNGP